MNKPVRISPLLPRPPPSVARSAGSRLGHEPSVPAGLRLQAAGEETGPQEEDVDRRRAAALGCCCGSADRTAGLALPL